MVEDVLWVSGLGFEGLAGSVFCARTGVEGLSEERLAVRFVLLMATLRVQGLTAVGSLSLAHQTKITSKSVSAGYNCTLNLLVKKNRLSVNHRPISLKTVRLNCRASDSSLESDDDVNISDIVLNSSDMDLSAISTALKKTTSESAARPPKFTTLRPFGEGGAGVMSGLEGSLFELLAANIQATADLKR